MPPNRPAQLKQTLIHIEAELRQLKLWSDTQPSAEALASPEPFCIDTLPLSAWLQWIFIPRMHDLLNNDLPLPNRCNIYIIAEESFKGLEQDCGRLLKLIEEFDQTLTLTH